MSAYDQAPKDPVSDTCTMTSCVIYQGNHLVYRGCQVSGQHKGALQTHLYIPWFRGNDIKICPPASSPRCRNIQSLITGPQHAAHDSLIRRIQTACTQADSSCQRSNPLHQAGICSIWSTESCILDVSKDYHDHRSPSMRRILCTRLIVK